MRITTTDTGLYLATLEGPDSRAYTVTGGTPQQLRREITKLVRNWTFAGAAHRAREERFLAAWKAAALIGGEDNFDAPSTGVLTAESLEELRPKEKVKGIADGLILAERCFLGFLLSLYSPGREVHYLHENRCADLAPIWRDATRTWLMAELLKWHPGRYDW